MTKDEILQQVGYQSEVNTNQRVYKLGWQLDAEKLADFISKHIIVSHGELETRPMRPSMADSPEWKDYLKKDVVSRYFRGVPTVSEMAMEYLKEFPMNVDFDTISKNHANEIGDGRIRLFAHWADEKLRASLKRIDETTSLNLKGERNRIAAWLENEDIQFPHNKEEWRPTMKAFQRAADAIRTGKMLGLVSDSNDPKRGNGPCADCGTENNPVWYTDNVFWNAVMGEHLVHNQKMGDDGGKILCINCFTLRAEKEYEVAWRLIPSWKWQRRSK